MNISTNHRRKRLTFYSSTPQPFPTKHSVILLDTEQQANNALRKILMGAVGMDTEFSERKPTTTEQIILDYFPHSPGQRKGAMTGLQIAELHAKPTFDVAWDNVGIRLIQIAWKDEVWVLDVRRIRGK